MKIQCEITEDYKNNPKIKVMEDGAEITLHCHTQNYNGLHKMYGKNLILSYEKAKE